MSGLGDRKTCHIEVSISTISTGAYQPTQQCGLQTGPIIWLQRWLQRSLSWWTQWRNTESRTVWNRVEQATCIRNTLKSKVSYWHEYGPSSRNPRETRRKAVGKLKGKGECSTFFPPAEHRPATGQPDLSLTVSNRSSISEVSGKVRSPSVKLDEETPLNAETSSIL